MALFEFDGVHCPICKEEYDIPKSLKCLHTICLHCLKDHCTPPQARCPLCSFVTEIPHSLDRLPTNPVVEAAVRRHQGKASCRNCSQLEATTYCRQCNVSLCDGCAKQIHSIEIFKSHDWSPLPGYGSGEVGSGSRREKSPSPPRTGRGNGEGRVSPGAGAQRPTSPNNERKEKETHGGTGGDGIQENCPRHSNEPISLFCSVCRVSVCRECAGDGSHRGHSPILPLGTVVNRIIKEDIPILLPTLHRSEVAVSSGIGNVEAAIRQVHVERERCATEIQEEFDRILARLDGRRKELMHELDQVTNKKLDQLSMQLHTMKQIVKNAQHSSVVALSLMSKEERKAFSEKVLVATSASSGSSTADAAGASIPVAPEPIFLPTVHCSLACICDIGGSLSHLADYISGQKVDTAPCVDTSITTSFDHPPPKATHQDHRRTPDAFHHAGDAAPAGSQNGLKTQLLHIVDRLGEIWARESTDRVFRFTGNVGDHEGLLYFLGCGRGIKLYQNPVTIGAVDVTCSSLGYGRAENIVAPARSTFCTQNQPSSWIALDLKDSSFNLTHYTLHHDSYDTDGHYLRNWEMQAWLEDGAADSSNWNGTNTTAISTSSDSASTPSSISAGHSHGSIGHHHTPQHGPNGLALTPSKNHNGGGRWVCLRKHQNDLSFTADSSTGAWAIQDPTYARTFFRRFRLIQTGPNSHGSHFLMLSGLELYGVLQSEVPTSA